MKQQRTLIVLIVAVATAGIAAYAVFQAIQNRPVREVEVGSVPVVVASRTVQAGVALTTDDLRIVSWPARSQVTGSYADPKDVINRGAIQTINENEPITNRNIASPESGAGLHPMIPQGMRAYSVRINEVIGVAGFTVPGTRVDVIVSVRDNGNTGTTRSEPMARTVVSNVQVLTAGTRYDQEESKQGGTPKQSNVVTLAVLPEEAERVALAAAEGEISLALRNPLDVDPTETPGVKLPALMRGPGPEPVVVNTTPRRVAPRPAPVVAVAPPPPPPAAPPARSVITVETIRAAKRTEEVID
jgi:pilus assembly protein CpaB